jgi:ABC-type multidrug transport system ATPase subunit
VLPGTLSVWEYLSFNAFLRLPAEQYDSMRRQQCVMHVIGQLGLVGVAGSFIGDAYTRGLSGDAAAMSMFIAATYCPP